MMEVDTGRRSKVRQPKLRRKSSSSTESASGTEDGYSVVSKRKKKRSAGISGTRRDGVMIVKGNWTDAEDHRLSQLVLSHNMNQEHKGGNNTRWSEIAKHLPGRVGKQCRERWHNHLRPDINKGRWSFTEEIVIYVCWRKWSSQWARISRLLAGRSDNRVKNHWNCHMKRRLIRDPPYAEFLENSAKKLLYLLHDGYEDDAEVNQLQLLLLPGVEEYITENQAVLERLPYFATPKRESKSGRDQPSPVVYHEVKLMLENPERPPKKPKLVKKERKTKKRIPPTFVETSWVDQSNQGDVENGHPYFGSEHFGRLGGVLYNRYEGISPDMDLPEENVTEPPTEYFYSSQDSQPYNSPNIQVSTEIVLGDEEPLLNGDPMWTKAVSIDYCRSSPSFSRRHTSTPLKSTSFSVPTASECGTSFVTPTHSRKPAYDFMLSPIRRPYFEDSIWSPSKLSGFGMKTEDLTWSPIKHGHGVIKTPQPIREAMASTEANRSNISPEDLASPSRLFSDASELIDGELNQSGDLRLEVHAAATVLLTPDVNKCRRRLMDQWSTGRASSSTFNSSGYVSFQGTPSTD